MAVTRALLQTREAFDGVAACYHGSNAENVTLCAMRARAWEAVDAFVPPGSHILDAGCGPGGDAEHLAGRGYRITAIDWSPAMVDEARRRVGAAGLADRVDVLHAGIHEIHRLAPVDVMFDAAYSNFGPLNCVDDLAAAARLIARRLRPGGVLIASVIGRVCPWEIALYLARGRLSRATIRFRRGFVPVPLEGHTVWTRYYTPGNFVRIFARAGFTRVSLRALGLFAPPPYLQGFAARHPALLGVLQRIDDRVGAWPGCRAFGDHFLVVLRKA
jgi:SAM-dependent methyltransferase